MTRDERREEILGYLRNALELTRPEDRLVRQAIEDAIDEVHMQEVKQGAVD